MTIKKNIEFCEKCEIRGRQLTLVDIEFCVGFVMLQEKIRELEEAIKNCNIPKIIDGACDITVTALNIPVKYNNIFTCELDLPEDYLDKAIFHEINFTHKLFQLNQKPNKKALDKILNTIYSRFSKVRAAVKNIPRHSIPYAAGTDLKGASINLAVESLSLCTALFMSLGCEFTQSIKKAVKAFEIVCDSNLSKICKDGSVEVVNGKVKKPDTFKAPDFSELLKDLTW